MYGSQFETRYLSPEGPKAERTDYLLSLTHESQFHMPYNCNGKQKLLCSLAYKSDISRMLESFDME